MLLKGTTNKKALITLKLLLQLQDWKAIRLLLSYAVNHNITLYQMDVKSAFLNDVISEEVFVKQLVKE